MQTKVAILLIFTVAAAALTRSAEPSKPLEATPPVESLKILGASYSYGGQHADVTERVKELLREDKLFSANPTWLQADPHPGASKALFIFGEVNGKPVMFSVGEDEDVSRAVLRKKAWKVAVRTEAAIDLQDKPADDYDDSLNTYGADRGAFPAVGTPVDEHGAPVIQTVRINDRVVGGEEGRVSGFRFRVDRSEAASKQKVADKTTLDFFWMFTMPPGVESWFIEPVKGKMQRGFDNFIPLKAGAFENSAGLLPKNKRFLVLQGLPSARLKEGEEYVLWFKCRDNVTTPIEMSVALGYRKDNMDFRHGNSLTVLSRFLGLVPNGDEVGDEARYVFGEAGGKSDPE